MSSNKPISEPGAGFLQRWRDQRALRRARADARHLAGECRRIVKKKRVLIPDAAAAEVEAAVVQVEAAASGSDAEALREALGRLDEQMDKHLAFARKSAWREYAESIGVAVGIAIFLRAFVVEAFQIPSGSMIPTLLVGDHIFVSKFSYGVTLPFSDRKLLDFGPPKRGDVIVFKNPKEPAIDYIKRVVGLPGDELEIQRNQIFINGQPIPREHLDGECDAGPGECEEWVERLDDAGHRTIFSPYSATAFGPQRIPANEVFMMGDNRDNSNDSRMWGTVPLELIKGRALIVWWSRGPTEGSMSLRGLVEWWNAIRWRRFFSGIH